VSEMMESIIVEHAGLSTDASPTRLIFQHDTQMTEAPESTILGNSIRTT
jgi:hypothetical protein